MFRYPFLLILPFTFATTWCARINIESNGYRNILVALPSNVEETQRARIVNHVEAMMRSSSEVLQTATKGRAYFSNVSFIMPHRWNIPEADPMGESTSFNSSTMFEAPAAMVAEDADIVITEVGQYPYVLHQNGCGKRAMRIILPKDFLLQGDVKGMEFTRLWSEYRYGVFPEGGFENDEMYPTTYAINREMNESITGCSDETMRYSNLCDGDDGHCTENPATSSLMDQHLSISARLFCEGDMSLGPRHDPEPPSKHNLICKEEGTWFTVMRSPDFAGGRNAAPRPLPYAGGVSFRFARESIFQRVIVAIETSSRMTQESRLLLTKSPLYRFVFSTLPAGSEVTLFLFGGEDGVKMEKQAVVLENEESRISFLESLSFPEDAAADADDLSLEHLFDVIFQTIRDADDDNKTASAEIVLVTTESNLDPAAYENVTQRISETESRLHIMLFSRDEKVAFEESSLYDLCLRTGGQFTSLHADLFGDLHVGFSKVVRVPKKEILIMQEYLKEDDDIDLEVSFILDESLTESLKVYLSFPILHTNYLQYKKTTLRTPSGGTLNFLKMEVLDAWVIDLPKPEVGEYILKTRRVADSTGPVLITVTGIPSSSEDPITANVWTETLVDSKAKPAPVKIYAEVKKGWNPVGGAQVTALIYHPDGNMSLVPLLDDGLGDVDITRNDGIYGSYFTNFTAPGYYNVHIKVSEGINGTEVLTGPDNLCCGSFFSAVTTSSTGRFQREAGPFTFQVPFFNEFSYTDRYPPSRVTDLRISGLYDRICVLQWTAVGDDYNSGFAAMYEFKVFRNRSIIRHRFSDSKQELYSGTTDATPEATYGTTLNYAFQLPSNVRGGVFYIAVRAIDEAGNAGEPSNAVPLWIEKPFPRVIDCKNKENCETGGCVAVPIAAKLQGNAATSFISGVVSIAFIPANVFVPIASLIFSLVLLNTF